MNSSPVEAPLQISINRLHWPVATLGFGRRIGIWMQGCSIRCKGCCSLDTWETGSNHATIECVLDWILHRPLERVDGFTVSGGEPFDQPRALQGLVRGLKNLSQTCPGERDTLVYSGRPWRRLLSDHADILRDIDVVISEPYVRNRPPRGIAGSDNQRMHRLSTLGQQRYPEALSQAPVDDIQMHYDGRTLWLIGIPRPGRLDTLKERLDAAGITMESCSWLP